MAKSRLATLAAWALVALTLLFLYLPLVPPFLRSLDGGWGAYAAILTDPRIRTAGLNSLLVGVLVAAITPLLALLAAQAVRLFHIPRLIMAIALLPLFVPGVAMGVATALFFRILGLSPSLLTIVTVQVLWALPFAFLILLTAMASFDPVYLESAHMSGAGPLRAFLEVELPLIRHGLLGAVTFSFILSLNETIRTAVVQGGRNTLPTYLWAQYQQVGLSPTLFALMSATIAGTLLLLVAFLAFERRQSLTASEPSP
jgi:ABC-type spermidine/putrescine transport system permease subunit II